MAEISAKDVMNLRNRTGLPMMDCKEALSQTGGGLRCRRSLAVVVVQVCRMRGEDPSGARFHDRPRRTAPGAAR